jgi:membrane protease YdiL (CAAX protease family)
MSILVVAGGSESVVGGILAGLLPLAAALLAAGAGMWAGLFRARTLAADPPRVPPGRPVWPLVVVLVAAVGMWLVVVPGLYLGFTQRGRAANQPSTADSEYVHLAPQDLVVLGLLGPAAGYLVLLLGDWLVFPRVGQRLGYGPAGLPNGVLFGTLGAVAVIPLVLATSSLAEWVYRSLHWQHPAEHDLLKAMGEAGSAARLLLVVAAVVVAPVWEEVLFRGHFQTILRTTFFSRRRQPAAAGAFEVIRTDPAPAPETAPLPIDAPVNSAEPADTDPNPRSATREAWAAIALTSVAFAVVHDAWTWPPIFVLSLGLGWVYERTRNLWVPTVIHALFNALSTTIYLFFVAHR